jgi:hypothetical protein
MITLVPIEGYVIQAHDEPKHGPRGRSPGQAQLEGNER